MKNRIYLSTFRGICFVVILIFGLYSCASTSSYIRQTKNVRGNTFLITDAGNQAMIDACKYGIKKAGLTLDKEIVINDSIVMLYSTLKASMQSWGQHVKITIIGGGNLSEKQTANSYYISSARVSMNVTEDLQAIRRNIETYAKNYLTAVKEGLDMTKFQPKN
jgi:hypothetical protein